MSAYQLPNLIIGGVHKAGTTSVFTYLSMHPQVCASNIKEIGFFMPLRYGHPIPSIEKYAAFFSHCDLNARYRLEASPSYIYGKEKIAEEIQQQLGRETKMIFIFRNPTDRLFSFYERKKANAYLPPDVSFSTFIKKSAASVHEELDEHRDDEEAIFIRGIREGMYIEYLPPWFDQFGDRLKILFFEDLKNDSFEFMRKLCQWLELDFSMYKPEDFKIENETIAYRNRLMHRTLLKINKKFEPFWRRNTGLKRSLRNAYKRVNASSAGREKMLAEERAFIEDLYRPCNQKLAAYLKEKDIRPLPEWLS
jgi:Sulfotransferase domain